MNNKLPQIRFVFDRYKKATLTKKASVEIVISYNYKQKYISTGVKLYSNQWKKGKIVNCPDTLEISNTLDKLLTNIRQVILNMTDEGYIDIYSIPERLSFLSNKQIGFMDYCYERFNIRKFGKAPRSIDRYNLFLRTLKEWGVLKRFQDVNENNLILLDKYLTGKNLSAYTRWHNYHRHLNSVILDAINEGFLTRNPYKNICLDKGREGVNIDNCLTPVEFRKLKVSPMPTVSLERVRDLFVFQTYTCLRYSDLKEFNPIKVQEIKGVPVYIGNSIKTNKLFIIPLLTPALEILHKYNGTLPIISNVKYNLYLKNVAQAIGIDKPISSHWARHTGATLLINEGVDMKIISKICGHSSTRITEQVYAKLLDETVVDAIQEISDRLE